MLASPTILWLIAGACILAADKMQSRVNLVYASYSAFMVGVFVAIGIMKTPVVGAPDYPYYNLYIVGQVIVFFTGCFVWAFVLRDAQPKSKLSGKAKEFYQNIVGKTVEVSSGGINTVSGGEVILNGKILAAKLAANSEISSVKAGTKMQVDEVIGDILVVSPLND